MLNCKRPVILCLEFRLFIDSVYVALCYIWEDAGTRGPSRSQCSSRHRRSLWMWARFHGGIYWDCVVFCFRFSLTSCCGEDNTVVWDCCSTSSYCPTSFSGGAPSSLHILRQRCKEEARLWSPMMKLCGLDGRSWCPVFWPFVSLALSVLNHVSDFCNFHSWFLI